MLVLWQQVVCNNPRNQIRCEVVNGAVSCMLNLTHVLQLIVDGLNDCSLPENQLVMQVHQRVLHFRDQMDAVHEEALTDVSPVRKHLFEKPFGEAFVFEWHPVIHIAQRELPLCDFASLVDEQMQLESMDAQPLIVLCICMCLMWHEASGVKSMMEMPVHLPNAQVCTKRLYERGRRNSFFMCRHT